MTGLLLIDKPQGKTSYGAVACVKRASGEKRVGHTGTLDPMATGVLPVLLGRATALCSYLLDADKRYTASVKLGIETDTCDITGTVLNETVPDVSNEQLNAALEKFTGETKQRPPMFSALKKDGVRLYELARKGESIEVPERDITVYSLRLIQPLNKDNEFTVEAHVSKGTYIRSLARDIGAFLGCGATLTALRRTDTSGFSINDCTPLDEINSDNIKDVILSEECVVQRFRAVQITAKQAVRFCNGGQLDLERLKIGDMVDGELLRVKAGDTFLGLGRVDIGASHLAVKCVIRNFEKGE